VLAAVARQGLDLEMALMHLVVFKHLRGFYHHLASLPLPVLDASASGGRAPSVILDPAPI
jgi:hypothetical protein